VSAARRRRLPPYARDLLTRDPHAPGAELRIYVGARAWPLADEWRAAGKLVIAFPGGDPGAFRWPVAGFECLVLSAGDFPADRIPLLAHHLLSAGASRVRAIDADGKFSVYAASSRARA